MEVSIIIVNYNTAFLTRDCIESIFRETKELNFEVIVVDNASSDESYSLFSNDDRIKYIYVSENLGFGKANNVGLKEASGKYIFLLNSDTLLLNDAVSIFYKKMEKSSPEVACLGTYLLNKDYNHNHSYGHFPSILNQLRSNGFTGRLCEILGFSCKTLDYNENFCEQQVDYITGADLFIRKTVVDKLGLFDPDFFLYYEETELQFRYSQSGYKSVIFPDPKIIHLEGGSAKKGSSLYKLAIQFESSYIYMKKTHGSLYAYLFKGLMTCSFMPLLLKRKYSKQEKWYFLKKCFS